MKRCFSMLYPMLTCSLLFALSGCKGGGGNETTARPVLPTDDYLLEITPANEQIIAIALDTREGVDLTPYIKSQGLSQLRINESLVVKQILGGQNKAQASNPCDLAQGNDLSIEIEFSSAGGCIFQYLVEGETSSGQTIRQMAEITIIGSQTPEFAVLPPMSLVLINPNHAAPYHIDLDALPSPQLAKKSRQDSSSDKVRQSSAIGNEVLKTGDYLFPDGFALTDVSMFGQGRVEANQNIYDQSEPNSLKYTAETAQQGYSHISYLIEKEGVEAKLGLVHISISEPTNNAPEVYDFCKAVPTGTDSVNIDLSPYVTDPDVSDQLRLKSILTHSGDIITDPDDPLKFQFRITNPQTTEHYISYLLEDGRGGFDSGQIKVVDDDGRSRVTHTLSAGFGFGYRLDEEKRLWVTGENNHGNLGIGNTEKQTSWMQPLAVKNRHFDAAVANQGNPIKGNNPAAAWRYGYLLDTDGFIWVSGNNFLGQLGTGERINVSTWQKITGCKIDSNNAANCPTFTQISAGSVHGYALDTKGRIWSAGYSQYGQLGRDDFLPTPYPHSPQWSISLCSDTYGEESENPNNEIPCPVFTSVSAGPYHGYAIDEEKNLWVIGNNRNGQLGVGEVIPMGDNANNSKLGGSQYRWIKINKVTDQNGVLIDAPRFIQASAGGGNSTNSFGYALSSDGYLYATGDANNGKLGNANLSDSANNRTHTWSKVTHARRLVNGTYSPVLFKEVSAGHEHVYALAKDCGLWGVGSNANGQLATGSSSPSQSQQWILPKKSDGRYFSGLRVTELSTGANMGYLKNNGIMWGVGEKNGLGLNLTGADNLYSWHELPRTQPRQTPNHEQ